MVDFVEAVGPVDTHQADHRQEDAHADACRAFHVEGIEFLRVGPRVTAFEEGQSVDGGVAEHEGIAQFEREAVVGVGVVIAARAGLEGCRVRDGAVFIAAQSDGFLGVAIAVAAHAVATHVEGLEGRFLVLVIGSEETELHARHQHQGLRASRECREGAPLELPFVVFNPAIFLLLLLRIGGRIGVVGQILVVFLVPERPWRRELYRGRELRAAAREERVVGRGAAEREVQADVVGVSVAHDGEILPVFERIAREGELGREEEIVVGPAQSLTPSERYAVEFDVFVGVVVVFVVVVIVAVTVAIEHVHVVVHVAAVVVGARHVGLLRKERAHGELDGAFVAEPVGGVARVVRLVVASVGLRIDAERFAVADGHDAAVFLVLVEEVGHREVVELQAHASDDARLSPSERELDLVVRFRLQIPVDIDRAVLAVGLYIRLHFLGVEMSRRGDFTRRTHQCVP